MSAARTARIGRAARTSTGVAGAAWRRRHEPRTQLVAAFTAIFVVASIAFAHVVEDYLTDDPIVRWDVELARWLHEHSSPALVDGFDVVTLLGNAAVLAVVVAALLFALLRRGAIADAMLLAVVALGIEGVNAALKLAFHRPRPELAFVHLDTYSFPSGHAAGSAAIYLTIAVLVGRRVRPERRLLVAAAVVALVLLVSFSRLYLGAHYLSDVLAGLALGTAWAAGWLALRELAGPARLEAVLPAPLARAARALGPRL